MSLLAALLFLVCAATGVVLLEIAHASAIGMGPFVMAGYRMFPRFMGLLFWSHLAWRIGRWTGGFRLRRYRLGDYADPDKMPPVYEPTWIGRWFVLRNADAEEALSQLDLLPFAPLMNARGVDVLELQKGSARDAVWRRRAMNGASYEELYGKLDDEERSEEKSEAT
jgi:hypothetical protein